MPAEPAVQGIEGVEGSLPPGVQEDLDVLRMRRRIGYVLGAVGIVSIWSALRLAQTSVAELVETKGDAVFGYAKLGMHGVIVVAWVWFSYQLLRAAERMIIPYWWLRQNLDAVKLMLGITDPWRAALKASEDVLEMSGKAAQQVAQVAGSVTSVVHGEKHK